MLNFFMINMYFSNNLFNGQFFLLFIFIYAIQNFLYLIHFIFIKFHIDFQLFLIDFIAIYSVISSFIH